jgi:hypothetical protein
MERHACGLPGGVEAVIKYKSGDYADQHQRRRAKNLELAARLTPVKKDRRIRNLA